jgi:hypothetical protein
MHLRVGMSPGFVARRHCSICDGDLSECEHVSGDQYAVIAVSLSDDECNICGLRECIARIPGSAYTVHAHGVIKSVDRLDEISAVARPRDPMARYEAVEIPTETVAGLLNNDAASALLRCERCTSGCTGFTSAEEALGPI